MSEAVQALIMRAGIVVNVTRADRHRLEAIIWDRSAPQKHVWRANIILVTADGCGTAEIMRRSGKSKPVVWRSGSPSAEDRLPKSLHFAEFDVIIGVVRARSVHEVGYGHK